MDIAGTGLQRDPRRVREPLARPRGRGRAISAGRGRVLPRHRLRRGARAAPARSAHRRGAGEKLAAQAHRGDPARGAARRRLRARPPQRRAGAGRGGGICRCRRRLRERDETGMVNAVLDQLARKLRAGEFADGRVDGRWSNTTPSTLIGRRPPDRALFPRRSRRIPARSDSPTTPPHQRRRRAATWCSRPTPSSAACISFPTIPPDVVARRRCASTCPISPPRAQRRSASCCRWRCRRRSARIGSLALRAGLRDDAEAYGCPLFGGDTDRTPGPITISIAMFGSVPQGTMVRRAGARPGDRVFVTGTIGDAALGLVHAQKREFGARWKLERRRSAIICSRAICCRSRATPSPKRVRTHASAAMDVSDGLAGDFAKLCRVSDVAAEIEVARVPLSDAAQAAVAADPAMLETALTGGDDYEIVCTVPAAKADASAPRRRRPTWRSPRSARSRRARVSASSDSRWPGARLQADLVQPFLTGSARHSVAVHRSDRASLMDAEGNAKRIRGNAMDDLTAKKRSSRCPRGSARISRRCIGASRVRPICGRARRRTCRSSRSNTATPAPALTSASRDNWAAFDADQGRAALRRHHHRAADRRRVVRHPLCGADRHRADGRAVAGVAGRRSDHGEGGAARARALHARRRRRRHHRGRRESRARRVLAAALSFLPERSRHRLRPDQAGDRGRRQGAGAHHRRAGAHHAHARNLCRAWAANSVPRRA